MPDNGLRKAAVLLVQMGREKSAKVMASMRDSEVEALTAEIARLNSVETAEMDSVLEEFSMMMNASQHVARGGVGFAREVLEATLGPEKAKEIMARLTASMMEMPFQFLHRADARQLLSFLQDEHPQTVALVVVHMSPDQAALTLSGFSPELQADVAHRVATMDRTSPEIIKQVEQTLERKLSSVLQPSDFSTPGGLELLVDIMNKSDRATERMILEGLERRDPELAEQVRAKMFVFEDITMLDDKSIQIVLRQIETSDLAAALKGVRTDVREKIMKNMSGRAAENLSDEIDLLGPVRLATVEEAQGRIVHAIRALEESGQLMISRGGEEFVS